MPGIVMTDQDEQKEALRPEEKKTPSPQISPKPVTPHVQVSPMSTGRAKLTSLEIGKEEAQSPEDQRQHRKASLSRSSFFGLNVVPMPGMEDPLIIRAQSCGPVPPKHT